MKYMFKVPDERKIRLIINTDAKNEADDQFAIVHALLTQKFDIKTITAAHFGTARTLDSMEESYQEIKKIIKLMELDEKISVTHGAKRALVDEKSPEISEGAKMIVEEAMKEDKHPLFAIFLGPLTDMASAYLMEPRIAERMTVIWIGGGRWPDGGYEFNLQNDIHAANVVLKSGIQLWQVPMDVYFMMRVSFAELQIKVRPYGKIGEYLFQQLIEFNDNLDDMSCGEHWSLGDSPAIGLLLDQNNFDYEEQYAPCIGEDMRYLHRENKHKIRVYKTVNTRFILEDMYAKLAINYS